MFKDGKRISRAIREIVRCVLGVYSPPMATRTSAQRGPTNSSQRCDAARGSAPSAPAGRPSSLIDTRVIYCGDCLEQLEKLPDTCIDLIDIDPPFNSNRNDEEAFRG